MKELSTHIKEDDISEIHAQVPKQTEYALMGKIKPHPGHTVWEFSLDTGIGVSAQYKMSNAYFSWLKNKSGLSRELVVKEGHIYIPALNLANATKKYNTSKRQSDYYKKEPPMKFTDHFV